MGIPEFVNVFSRLKKGNKFLDGNYFQEGEIKGLPTQRNKFEEALKQSSNPKPKPPQPISKPEPKKEPESKKKEAPKLYSVKMKNELVEKRHMYLRSVFRDEDDIYEIQSRYVEYEHQMRRVYKNINEIMDSMDDKEGKHQNAVMTIYNEMDYFTAIQNYNNNNGFTDFKNLEKVSIPQMREDMSNIITKNNFPEKVSFFQNQEKLRERGNSILGEEHLPKSILNDKSFIRKKDQIRTLRSQNMPVISKKVETEEVENVPEINVKSPKEEEEKEHKDLEKIGEDYGEQVSQINVEEDSEIEYNLENINGKIIIEINFGRSPFDEECP
jgi:hypothetical protein